MTSTEDAPIQRTAIVTGASKGIGFAIAERLVADGYNVVGCARTPGAAAAALSAFGDSAVGVDADVANPDDIKAVIDAALTRFGALDVLVNNAGIYRRGSILEMDPQDWIDIVSVNLTGTFLFCQAAARAMLESRTPDERDGRIVNIGSVNAVSTEKNSGAYSASKAGMHSLTRSLSVELADSGITATCVAPGWVDTDIDPVLQAFTPAQMKRLNPLGRAAESAEVAHMVAALCHPLGRHTNGAIVVVDGGQHNLQSQPE